MFLLPSFAYNEENLVFYVVGQEDLAQFEATHPACHFVAPHGVEYFAELLYLVGAIVCSPTETVEFFVVVVFDVFADAGQQAVFLADFVLSAAFGVLFLLFCFESCRVFFCFLEVAEECCDAAKYEDCYDGDG